MRCAHDRERQILVGPLAIGLAHRHGLDQRQVDAAAMGETDQVVVLVLVHALERDRVEFDLEAHPLRCLDASHDLGEVAPTRDGPEAVRLQGVERYVDAADSQAPELFGVLRELAAVGGERLLLKRVRPQVPGKDMEEPDDVLADQRLAAGDADLLDPRGNLAKIVAKSN